MAAPGGTTTTTTSGRTYSFKAVLLGEGCVGKTSLVLRYCENKFNDKHITTLQVNTDNTDNTSAESHGASPSVDVSGVTAGIEPTTTCRGSSVVFICFYWVTWCRWVGYWWQVPGSERAATLLNRD